MLKIYQLPVLQDNYIYILHDLESKQVAAVDPANSKSVIDFLDHNNLSLNHIINTHHHWDHTGGNLELQEKYQCQIWGAKKDAHRIPGINQQLVEGDFFPLGKHPFQVIETFGHTLGHICYYSNEEKILFSGDTLFSMGCGRLFEGDAKTMHESLTKLKGLNPETLIYCTHEYTQSNGKFAAYVDSENQDLHLRLEQVNELRAKHLSTIPVSLKIELLTNPFLRTESPEIRSFLKMHDMDEWKVFQRLREMKDSF